MPWHLYFALSLGLAVGHVKAEQSIALPDGSAVRHFVSNEPNAKGELLLLSGVNGSQQAHSALPMIAETLTPFGWSSFLPERQMHEAFSDQRLADAFNALSGNATSTPRFVVAIAENDAAIAALTLLQNGQVQAVIWLNADAAANAALKQMPEKLNGKIMELCSPGTQRSSPCEQRQAARLPQLTVHTVPAADAQFSLQPLWIRNLMHGFLMRQQQNFLSADQ